jgi:predicted Fe-Mo cluster-binding NifX family protein
MKENGFMRIAIPVAAGKLALHFGHCDAFALVDVDPEKKEIIGTETADAPPHQPGLLPVWLAERGVKLVIAGGMGARAQELFAGRGIRVMVGAPSDSPEALVGQWLKGELVAGANVCDH